jgi:hypothetical protein
MADGSTSIHGLYWCLSFLVVRLALDSSIGVRYRVPCWPLVSLLPATALSLCLSATPASGAEPALPCVCMVIPPTLPALAHLVLPWLSGSSWWS